MEAGRLPLVTDVGATDPAGVRFERVTDTELGVIASFEENRKGLRFTGLVKLGLRSTRYGTH